MSCDLYKLKGCPPERRPVYGLVAISNLSYAFHVYMLTLIYILSTPFPDLDYTPPSFPFTAVLAASGVEILGSIPLPHL